jgi:hypothetical protein
MSNNGASIARQWMGGHAWQYMISVSEQLMCFLGVVGADPYKQWTLFEEKSGIRQEDVVQGSSIVDVLTLRMCNYLESVISNCSYDV